jgi:hypothetical protein
LIALAVENHDALVEVVVFHRGSAIELGQGRGRSKAASVRAAIADDVDDVNGDTEANHRKFFQEERIQDMS